MKMNMKKHLLRGGLAVLCLCVMFCCAACAEGAVDLANTGNHDGFLGFCTLPDGGLVMAGFTETRGDYVADKGRIICLNADRSVRWTYTDEEAFTYATVAVTKDGLIAAYSYDGVQFFTPEGKLTGGKLPLRYTDGEIYDITALGVLSAKRVNEKTADYVTLKDWNGNRMGRINEPESMWVGSAPVAEEDGLVLFGREAGEPGKARAKIMKADLEGNEVWACILPFLSDNAVDTGLQSGMKTSDGGYLAVQWETFPAAEDGYVQGRYAMVKFGPDGRMQSRHMQDFPTWLLAEYNGKYVACGRDLDPRTGETVFRYMWMNTDGSTEATSEYRIRREDVPPYADGDHMVVTVENLFPTDDGLWQVVCFWDTDEPEEEDPAYLQQDNVLIRVPEP